MDFEKNLEFLENIDRLLDKRGTISLLDYEKYKNIIDNYKTQTGLEESIMTEKLKVLNEKILQKIKDKKPFTFIHDYFIGGKEIEEIDMGGGLFDTKDSQFSSNLGNIEKSYKNTKTIYEGFQNINIKKFDNLTDSLILLSNDFLKIQLGLSENDILDLKGHLNIGDLKLEESKFEKTPEEVEIKFPEIIKIKPVVVKKTEKVKPNISAKNNSNKLDKEIEEELGDEILNYIKGMKNYGHSFHDILSTDNKKLNKIELQQLKDQSKTDKELKNLNEFNYTLKIGFWKTLLMIIVVIVTFMFTMLVMRIFPKFVK
jgi:hypothetical protein